MTESSRVRVRVKVRRSLLSRTPYPCPNSDKSRNLGNGPNPGDDVEKDFKSAFISAFAIYGGVDGGSSDQCGLSLTNALQHLDEATPEDLIFVKSCTPLTDQVHVERYKFYVKGAVSSLAMLDYPYPCNFVAPLPANPIQEVLDLLLGLG